MKKIFVLLTGVVALFFSACGDPYISLATQEKVDAAELKAFCESKKLITEETKQADKEFALGQAALQEGNSHVAFTAMGQASSLYKIAISKHRTEKRSKKIAALNEDLKKDKASLVSYQNLLADVKVKPVEGATDEK